MSVRFSAATHDDWREAARSATGAAIGISAVAGAACAAGGWAGGGSIGRLFVVLGALTPGLLLQDCWRFAFFAGGRPRGALVNDVILLAVQIPALIVVSLSHTRDPAAFLLAWGVPAAVAAIAGAVQARLLPLPALTLRWWRTQRDLASRFLVEFALTMGTQQMAFWGVGAAAGLAAAGRLRAGYILVSPVLVLGAGVALVTIPEGVRLLQRSSTALARMCAIVAAGLALAASAWGALLLILPARALRLALGSAATFARPLVLPLSIAIATWGISSAALSGLRSLAAARRSMWTSVATAPVVVVSIVLGARLDGARGAAWGMAAANAICAAAWWNQFVLARRAFHPSGAVPGPTLAQAPAAVMETPLP